MTYSFFTKLMLFLGHGRALESYLIGLKFILAITILSAPANKDQIVALWDLTWYLPEVALALPFVITGLIQLTGLILNYNGSESSWILRLIGAILGIFIWVWLITKSILIGQLHTGLFPVAVMSSIASVWIIYKAWNRLPVPSTIGLI